MTSRFEPPSLEQTRLWLLHRLSGGSAAYHRRLVLRMVGRLDERALARAIELAVARHEPLRTVFTMSAGSVAALVQAEALVALDVDEDVARLPAPQREGAATRRARIENERPFDLEAGPLLRATLIAIDARTHLLCLVAHAIVCDGDRSFGVLVREIAAAYGAIARGEAPQLGAPPPRFRAIVAREAAAQDAIWPAQIERWKAELRGAAALLELPTEDARPAVMTFEATASRVTLSADQSERVRAVAAREGESVLAVLVACLAFACHRHAGQDDVVLGTELGPRDRDLGARVFGPLENPAALRVLFGEGLTLRGVLARGAAAVRFAEACGDVPFERVLGALATPRDLRHGPVFQVLVRHAAAPDWPAFAGDLAITVAPPFAAPSPHDVVLSFSDEPSGLIACDIAANRALFDIDAIERLVHHVGVAAACLDATPDAPLAATALLTPAERHELTVLWNQTSAPRPRGCVHALFELQVAQHRDATALTFQGRAMSYGELSRRSSQLAHVLRRHGVGPDVIVGLSVDRSIEMVVAMLGIMKAGGAYLPLDPAYPPDRLAYMLDDAGVPALVTQRHLEGRLPSHGAATIYLDPTFASLDAEPDAPPESGASPSSLAYVIYTSGSTGRPKGVMVTHEGVGNLAAVQARHFGAGPASRVLQFASMSFDASLFEVVMALLNGATLCLGTASEVMPGPELERLLAAERVTIAVLPPTALAYMNEAAVPALETLIVAGEACPPDLLRTWAAGRRFVNAYGPTETTVMATFAVVRPGTRKPPIGRPMANFEAYVLDEAMAPVPIGAAGELYIGGVGLARGYLNRPELTAERFVRHPFSGDPAARLYRTGDRVRHLPDASLDFLGRADDQVKIRGFRIELGEVEAAVARHPSVRECAVVVAVGEGAGDKRLVAFVVAQEGAAIAADALRAHAKIALPQHMVPSSFEVIDALPLTPNAKIDRKALLARTRLVAGDEAFTAPRTPAEEAVASIFAEVLRLERASATADFFALGGHSLTAVRVTMKLEERFHVAVPLRLVFERPTVEALALELTSLRGTREAGPSIGASSERERYPLTYAQEQVWFVDGLMPGHHAYNHPSVSRLRGPLRVDVLTRALGAVVERHAPLRTTFARVDDRPAQIVAREATVTPIVVDLAHLPAAERESEALMVAREAQRHAFDLARGPLVQVTVIRLDAGDHVLVVNLHHIVSDAWSMGLLMDELGALYAAFARGAPSPLPALPVGYGDFAVHQRQAFEGEGGGAAQLAYWRQKLAGVETRLDLPFDRPRPAIASFRGGTERIAIPRATTEALRALCRAEGTTTFTALVASFAVLIGRYARRDDFLLGVPTAGRTRKEVERLIGMLTNILVLRADLAGAPTFRALIGRVKASMLEAHEHQDVPFERVVSALAPPRTLSHNPLVQVAFVPQDVPFEGLSLGDVEVSPVTIDRGVAQFDLIAFTIDGPEGVGGWVEYATDLFAPATVARMIAAWTRLVAELVAHPDRSVAEASLASPEEQAAVAEAAAAAAALPAAPRPVHHVVAGHAAQRPDAVAIESSGDATSYAELVSRARRIASHLRDRGARPGDVVAIDLPDGAAFAAAMVGALSAGCAYLPLTASEPAQRRERRVRALTPRLVIASGASTFGGVEVVDLEADAEAIARAAEAPLAEVDASSPACVLPIDAADEAERAVILSHAVLAEASRSDALLAVGPADRVARLAPAGSVVGQLELGAALAGGAALVVPDASRRGSHDLASFLVGARVTTAFLTAPRVRAVASREARALAGLARLFVGADEASLAAASAIPPAARPARVVALHVTPAAPIAFAAELGVELPAVVAGTAAAGCVAIVLDERLRPLPIGAPGALYAGGALLAAEHPTAPLGAFVDVALGGATLRLARTGDVARMLDGGRVALVPAPRAATDGVEAAPASRLPRSPIEDAITRAFEDVLQRAGIGVDDDFFELGGHSLKAAQVVARLERELDVAIGLRRFFERATVSALAHFVESAASLRRAPMTAIAPATVRRSTFLSFGQEALFRLDGERPGLGYHMPLAFRLRGPLDTRALEGAFLTVLDRHEPLRASFRRIGSEPAQIVLQSVPFIMPVVDLTGLPAGQRAHEAMRLGTELLRRPFDIAMAPLVRARVYRLGPDDHLLAVSMHHIVGDGWSLGLLLRELEALYTDAVAPAAPRVSSVTPPDLSDEGIDVEWDIDDGVDVEVDEAQPSDLGALERRYADFTAWQRRWLRPDLLEPELAFWRGYLDGAPAAIELVTDRPREERPSYGGSTEAIVLDAALSAAIRGLGSRHGATLFMTSLALFGLVLRAQSGATDIVVGAASSGRGPRDVEALIGCFFNKIALRVRPRDELAFADYLAEVRDATLRAFEHQDLPFELVARDLAPTPPAGRQPIFQVAYAPQESGWEELTFPGVTSQAVFLDRGMAPLDLTLYTRDSPGGLRVWIEHDTGIFDGATVKGMLRRFEALARAVTAGGATRVGTLLRS